MASNRRTLMSDENELRNLRSQLISTWKMRYVAEGSRWQQLEDECWDIRKKMEKLSDIPLDDDYFTTLHRFEIGPTERDKQMDREYYKRRG